MSATQIVVLGVGAVLEFVGILILAAPDLVPYRDRLSRWLLRRRQGIANRLRRLVRLPPRPATMSMSAALSADAAMSISAVKQPGEYATLEEKVEFLLRRDVEAQEAANELTDRVRELEDDLPKRLDALDGELRVHVTSRVRAAQAEHRQLRVLGALALAVGLACTTAASFV